MAGEAMTTKQIEHSGRIMEANQTKKTTKKTIKKCSKCKLEKSLTNFYKNGRNGYRANCKECHLAIAKASQKEYRAANKAKERARQKAWLYKLTPFLYLALLEDQGYACQDCKKPFSNKRKPEVDHFHGCCPGKRSCGQCVRGLLCHKCNVRRAIRERLDKLVSAHSSGASRKKAKLKVAVKKRVTVKKTVKPKLAKKQVPVISPDRIAKLMELLQPSAKA
jgi:hypothetical protein